MSQLSSLLFSFDGIPFQAYYILYGKKVYRRWVNFERKNYDGLVNFADFDYNFSMTWLSRYLLLKVNNKNTRTGVKYVQS